MPKPTALACALAVGGATAALVLGAAPATAASADLAYSCTWDVGETRGAGDAATASWDSGITDGLTVPVGTSVALDPYSGTVTLPDAFVAALRAQERTELAGGGLHLTVLEETEELMIIELSFESTPVPAEGPMTLTLEGVEPEAIEATEPGTYTLLASDFILGSNLDENLGLGCELTDEGDPTIDAFEAVAATTPPTTTAPSATASPVRPALVQTDAPEDEGTPALPAALLGAGALTVAVLGRRSRRTAATRRH